MPEVKITEMPELLPYDNYTLEGGTDGADYLPIIDVSETDPDLQNKKVSIQTVFDDYTRLYNSNAYVGNVNSIDKITLTNNFYTINNNSSTYILLDPNNFDRDVEISLLNQGETRFIKNVGSNLINLTNLLTSGGTVSSQYNLPSYETVQVFFDGVDHHVIYLDQTVIFPDSKLTVNSSAPSVTSGNAGLLGLNNNIPQYVNNTGTWVNLNQPTSAITYQQLRLRRITNTQSISANTFTPTAFNQTVTIGLGTSIGSYNTATNVVTLNTTGQYIVQGLLTFNNGVVNTRTIFYAEAPSTGAFAISAILESGFICSAAGSFMMPVNLVLNVQTAPITFTFTVASSTAISLVNANSTLSSFAESQVIITKLN